MNGWNSEITTLRFNKFLLDNWRGKTPGELASIWNKYTGLPFVFALFASYEKAPKLSEELSKALSSFVPDLYLDYFSTLNYHLDNNHFKGIKLFHALR